MSVAAGPTKSWNRLWHTPSVEEAEAGVWEDDGRTPCAPLSNDASLFRQTMLSLGGIPRCKSPHSSPLCCIHPTNSVSLPGSILSTPSFSTQPSPALEGSCPRQGCPPLIPKGVLGWAVLRPLEPIRPPATFPQAAVPIACAGSVTSDAMDRLGSRCLLPGSTRPSIFICLLVSVPQYDAMFLD